MKKTFYLTLIVLSALSLVCCSQQTVKEVEFNVQCGTSASETVTLSADTNADAYVFTGGAYVSVTANPYSGEYGTLQVVRNNSDWSVSYTSLYQEGLETISVVIGVSSGATLSKQNGTINVKCSVTAEPTKDQLNVTTSCETFVIGSPAADSPYQQAVNKRLEKKVSVYNTETTKAIVIYSNAFGTLTEEQKANVVDCWQNGGDVAFVSNDNKTVANILVADVFPKLREKTYEKEVTEFNTKGLTYEDWYKYRGKKLWYLSELEDKLTESDIVTVGFHIGNRYTYQSASGNLSSWTDYQAGLAADGLARWINTTTAEETKGSSELDDLCQAEIFTKEYEARMTDIENFNESNGYQNIIQEIFTVYTSYDEINNRDWYDVSQKITFRNASTDPVPDMNENTRFWVGHDLEGEEIMAVLPLKSWTNRVFLGMTGTGETVVYESHPDTANEEQKENYATPQGKTVPMGGGTQTPGIVGAKLAANFALSFANMAKKAAGVETCVGSSKSISDLSVTKISAGNGVDWTYKLKEPKVGISHFYAAWEAPLLALTDCPQENSLLFYVDDPSGVAKISSNISYIYNCLYVYPHWAYDHFENKQFHIANVLELGDPKRYVEVWMLQCVDYGDIADDVSMMEFFEASITTDIIGGSENRKNNIGGTDANDTTDANRVFNQFMNEFKSLEESYGKRGFTGTYTFKLKRVSDPDKYLEKSYTIKKP